MPRKLSHENLHVYQLSTKFLAVTVSKLNKLPRGNAQLADQLRRASLSIPLNIAEATGRPSTLENARPFAIARGSALECGAILDVCEILKLNSPKDMAQGKDLLISIVAMLSKLCRISD